ncbi:MAG: hypothetical protein Q8S22_07220 [Eubacteriales bacterium]|jgi:uncharacterized protein YjbJ (UPF0337 family)|nr:hypothetical protein [Eubacteriales bacterium]
MNNLERKLNRTKNKISGVVKQTAGKVTGDEVLELKGRIQSSQADLQKKTDVHDAIDKIKQTADKGKASVAHKVKEVQQSVAKKINDTLDEQAQKKAK